MKQITIVTENRAGILAEVSEALANQNINIDTLDAESHNNLAIMILTVDRYDEALQILNQQLGLEALSEDAILVKLSDEPGALAKIAKRFKEADINIRSIRIVRRDGDQSLVAISTERTQDAMALVQDILVS